MFTAKGQLKKADLRVRIGELASFNTCICVCGSWTVSGCELVRGNGTISEHSFVCMEIGKFQAPEENDERDGGSPMASNLTIALIGVAILLILLVMGMNIGVCMMAVGFFGY